MKEIKVSVFCIAYNHEKYLRKALGGILNQKTSFDYEIIVHDDCSTDETPEIIKEYEKKYSNVIMPIYESVNQQSKGISIIKDVLFPVARGKYIAICEGDDYWIDENKLQLQYDAMERNSNVDMCACGAVAVKADDEIELYDISPKEENCILSTEEVILGGGRYLATPTLFFRREIFDYKMDFEKILFFDYTNQIRGSLKGGVLYIANKMAAYRVMAEGSWSQRVESADEKRKAHQEKEKKMLMVLDEETQFRYHNIIEQRISAYSPFYIQFKDKIKIIKEKLSKFDKDIYIWGMGMRGNAFQKICVEEKIIITGVCDKRDEFIGDVTNYGYVIYSTTDVINKSQCIVATNDMVEKELRNKKYRGAIINLQKYTPLS